MRYWQVFGGEKKIEIFLQSKDEFEDRNIEIYCEEDSHVDVQIIVEKQSVVFDVNIDVNILANKTVHKIEIHKDPKKEEFKVLKLKDNILPRGLVPLEELFDFNDVAKKSKIEPMGGNIEECNIGTEQIPKIIKLSKSLPIVTKRRYIALFKEFIDVFSWSYEELKAYDTSII